MPVRGQRIAVIKQPTSKKQVLALYGGVMMLLRELASAYGDTLAPDRLEDLAALKLRLVDQVKNVDMSGLPLEEQPRVVEMLLGLLDAAYPGIEIDGERII